jgi:uncharacterized glyoxalase superfamily protein PhnB
MAVPTVKLFRVVLQVSSVNKASMFYTQLLGNSGKRVSAGRHYFNCGGVILACFEPKADGDKFEPAPNPDHVYLGVSDLEAVFERAKRAGCQSLDAEIVKRPWGERSFYCKDPFGNPLCFVDEKTMFTG